MTKNSINYFRVKHINMIYYYVKNKIANELMKLMYISIINMITDELIKSLKAVKFKSFRFIMRMLLILEEAV